MTVTAHSIEPTALGAGPTLSYVWKLCQARAPHPITILWLEVTLIVSDTAARHYVHRLRSLGCLKRIGGDGRGVRFEVVPGATLPEDGRGKHWGQKRSALTAGAARTTYGCGSASVAANGVRLKPRRIRA